MQPAPFSLLGAVTGDLVAKFRLVAASAAAALAGSSPATAAVYHNVYRGEVLGGVDTAGDFCGPSLAGQAYPAIFKDDKTGSNTGAGPYNEQATGEPGTGVPIRSSKRG